MNDELLLLVEREVVGRPGISKETYSGDAGQGGFWLLRFTVYRFGRRQIEPLHDADVAELLFP